MSRNSFKITGLKELDKKLQALPGKVAKKVLRQALRKALKPVKAAVQANAPVLTGQTRAAVRFKAGRRTKNRVTLNVQVGEGDYKGDQFYASFLEFGYERDGVLHPGLHFMERALAATGDAAVKTCVELIAAGVERIATQK